MNPSMQEVEQQVTRVARCDDCGLAYGSDGWIEGVIPDATWRAISPTGDEGGLLCLACMARRLTQRGMTQVPVMLCGTEALRVATQDEAFERGWNAARTRIEELERDVQLAYTRAAAMVVDVIKRGHVKVARIGIDVTVQRKLEGCAMALAALADVSRLHRLSSAHPTGKLSVPEPNVSGPPAEKEPR